MDVYISLVCIKEGRVRELSVAASIPVTLVETEMPSLAMLGWGSTLHVPNHADTACAYEFLI